MSVGLGGKGRGARSRSPPLSPVAAVAERLCPRCCLPWRGPEPALGPSLRPHGPRLGEARAERKVGKNKQGA